MTITAMQVLYKTIMASENTRAFRCTAALKNYLTDINIHEHCLCVKSAEAFFFVQNSQKFALFHKIYREKNIPFYGGNRMRLTHYSFHFGGCSMLENKFKTRLVKELKERFPGCKVVHLDPNEVQGHPDLLVLYGHTWGALEGKRSADAPHRPNQDYYVQDFNSMSFAAFIYPENKEEVLNAMERSFEAHGAACLPRSQ